jgi:hypothetical protein
VWAGVSRDFKMLQKVLLCGALAAASTVASPADASRISPKGSREDGFTVCGAGDEEMNGYYQLVTATEFKHNASSFDRKRLLHFDVVPPAGVKGPYAWELYTYELLKAAISRYAAPVDDLIDPPKRGWLVLANGTAPAPTVLRGALPCMDIV